MERIQRSAPPIPERHVQWADQWMRPQEPSGLTPCKVLDSHEVARRIAKIKAQSMQHTAPPRKAQKDASQKRTAQALKLEKPKWTPIQRFLRGEALGVIAAAAMFTSLLCVAFIGPIAFAIPAVLGLYCCVAIAYRTFGPDPQTVAREQAIKRAIAANLANDARALRKSWAIKDARVAEKMVKRWK